MKSVDKDIYKEYFNCIVELLYPDELEVRSGGEKNS